MRILLKVYLIAALASALLVGGGVIVSELVIADTASTTVDVGNATPVVSAVSIDGGAGNVTLTPNTTSSVTFTVTVSDNNGCEDVFSSGTIVGVFYRSGATNASSCTDDAVDCYQNITFTEVGDTCSGGTSGDAVATSGIWFFADATDASSTFSAENWLIAVTATDASNASASSTDGIEMDTSIGLEVQQSTTNFAANSGALAPNGTSTLADIGQSTTTVDNTGNDNIDLELNVGTMTSGGNNIFGSNQKWATSSLGYESLTFTGSSTATAFNLTQTTTSTASSSISTYWGLLIPGGQATGTYAGTNTFIVIWSSD